MLQLLLCLMIFSPTNGLVDEPANPTDFYKRVESVSHVKTYEDFMVEFTYKEQVFRNHDEHGWSSGERCEGVTIDVRADGTLNSIHYTPPCDPGKTPDEMRTWTFFPNGIEDGRASEFILPDENPPQ